MKRARIIYNPTSGREIFKKQLPDVLERLEIAGYETSCHATTCEGDATNAAQLAAERKFDLIISAGGDGTLHEIINGIADQEYRPKLGVIPVGTTNDFARAIGVNKTIEEACEVIIDGISMPVDIGVAMNEGKKTYFINIAAGGTLTGLTYEVPSKMKTVLGQFAYYLKGVEMLPSFRPTAVDIEYDGKEFSGEIMLFMVSLTNSVGGFEKIAPDSLLNDGFFDLVVLKKVNFAEFVQLTMRVSKGEHIHDPNVIYTKANRIKVRNKEMMQLNLDGEYGGLMPSEFVNLYHHIEVFVPHEKAVEMNNALKQDNFDSMERNE